MHQVVTGPERILLNRGLFEMLDRRGHQAHLVRAAQGRDHHFGITAHQLTRGRRHCAQGLGDTHGQPHTATHSHHQRKHGADTHDQTHHIGQSHLALSQSLGLVAAFIDEGLQDFIDRGQ